MEKEPYVPLLTEAQRQELERRLADHKANPNDVVPWEQIKAESLARMAARRRRDGETDEP